MKSGLHTGTVVYVLSSTGEEQKTPTDFRRKHSVATRSASRDMARTGGSDSWCHKMAVVLELFALESQW